MTAMTVVLSLALAVAVAASAGAMFGPVTWRRRLLAVAAATYMVAGVLGILSIGIVFIATAVVCALLAMRPTGAPLRE